MQPDPVQAFAQSPQLAGGVPIYLTGEDAVLVTVFNSAANVRVNFTSRFLPVARDADDRPRIGPQQQDFAPATDRSASTMIVGLGEGWLIDWQLNASAGAPLIGQCYAKVEIQRGVTSIAKLLSRLGRGYVTAKQGPEGPFGCPMDSLDGGGALRAIAGATPAAGAEIAETVPTGARFELISFAANLVCSAAVATRAAVLRLDDGTTPFYKFTQGQQLTASQSAFYVWAQGLPVVTGYSTQAAVGGLPVGNALGAGHRMRTETFGLQAADQWSAVQYLVRERVEGA